MVIPGVCLKENLIIVFIHYNTFGVRESLEIISLYNPNHPKITPSDLATKARAIMRDLGVRFLPVVEGSRLVGALGRAEILNLTSTRSNMKVSNIMYEPTILLTLDSEVVESTLEMLRMDEWYVPVVKTPGTREYAGVYGLDDLISYYAGAEFEDYKEPVSKFMSRNVVYVEPEEPVHNIWFKMLKHRYAGFPVVDKGRVVGVVTQHDLIRYGFVRTARESERSKGMKEVSARDIMTTPPTTVHEDAELGEAIRLMISRGIGRVIVVDRSRRLRGIFDREDAARAIISCLQG